MKQAVGNTLNRTPKGKIHADMSESAVDRRAARVNLGRAADQGDQDQTGGRPNRPKSLTGGDHSDSPTDENGRAEIKRLASLEIQILEPMDWAAAERRIGTRQKDLPTRPQNEQGNEPGPSQKKERSETEHRPRRSDAPGLKLALLYHRL